MCCNTSSEKGCSPACGKVGHLLATFFLLLGLLSLIAAWVATKNGVVWDLPAEHWYMDVTALALLGLLSGVNALFHAAKRSCGGSCGDEKDAEKGHVCEGGKCSH